MTPPGRDPDTLPLPPPVAGRPVRAEVLALAWPALAQQGLLLSIQLYDQFLTGEFSAAHRAALTTAGYIYWFVTAYAVVVNAGATALVGRFVGARDFPLARRAAGQALVLAAAFGVAGAALGLAFLPAFVRLLSLPEEGTGYAVEYLTPLAGLLPFYMVEVGGIACLVGAGDTRSGLKVLATAVVVNVPLAYELAFGKLGWGGLGFAGIAWGTGLSHVVGCGLVIAILTRGRFGLRVTARYLKPDANLMYRLLRVSVPAAVDSMSVGVFQFAFLKLVNTLGVTAASAHGIAIRLEGLGYLSGAAFGTAAVSLVGRALGAGRPDLAAKSGWTAFALGVGVMSAMGVVFFVFAEPLAGLFARDPVPGEVELAARVLRLVAFAMPGLAATIVLTQALRGAGDTRVPVLFTWVGFVCVRLPLAYGLTDERVGLGLLGAWLGMFVDIYVRGALFVFRFLGGRWKRMKV